MNAMAGALAQMNDVNYVDVAGKLFEAGHLLSAWQSDPGVSTLLDGGNLYGGFRDAPTGMLGHPLLNDSPKVLLVRDPRDALVSEYFSNAYSHKLPGQGDMRDFMIQQREQALKDSVASYVLNRAKDMRRTIQMYRPFYDLPLMKIYRYEQAIMDKRWFLRDLCTHFGWTVGDVQLEQIMGWADVMPEAENPTQFVRKVRPGDHLDKLDQATIIELNTFFAEELDRFGYTR